jgi:hypothetical protein
MKQCVETIKDEITFEREPEDRRDATVRRCAFQE